MKILVTIFFIIRVYIYIYIYIYTHTHTHTHHSESSKTNPESKANAEHFHGSTLPLLIEQEKSELVFLCSSFCVRLRTFWTTLCTCVCVYMRKGKDCMKSQIDMFC